MEKITLTGVPETMLQTVFARAQETQKQNHKIADEKAVELVSRLDYDFSLAKKDKTMSSGVIARTLVLDRMVKQYLHQSPDAVVINLACGLDTRCYRIQGYSHWYNLDLPEVMALREKLLPEESIITQIASSAMDANWAQGVAADGKPMLVIIEGLTMYLTETDIQQIFAIIAAHFPNVTVFVETMTPFIVKAVKEKSIEGSHAKFAWGVKDGKALAALLPGFAFVEEHSLVEGMEVIAPVYRVIGRIPFVRNLSNRIVVLAGERTA
ncbi:MAG: class I SAM-dependent methyltransferase [Lachnospiraceae bacterium]|nr:class I SAM-dependent methyltransferase [Lachnospiraceae bacterium]MCD7956739.1 class I SAM-dependent methyltransferase [Lachnospiraceae bacterium]